MIKLATSRFTVSRLPFLPNTYLHGYFPLMHALGLSGTISRGLSYLTPCLAHLTGVSYALLLPVCKGLKVGIYGKHLLASDEADRGPSSILSSHACILLVHNCKLFPVQLHRQSMSSSVFLIVIVGEVKGPGRCNPPEPRTRLDAHARHSLVLDNQISQNVSLATLIYAGIRKRILASFTCAVLHGHCVGHPP